MKTKVLMLMAVIGLVSANFAKAQTNAYSSNCVGFLNINVPPGFSIIANQMVTTNSTLNALFPYPDFPPGTTIYKFNGAGYEVAIIDEFDLAWAPNLTLVPGEAAFIRNPAPTNITATFVGEVKQGDIRLNLPTGFAMVSWPVPIQFPVSSFPGQPGDTVYKYENPSGYVTSIFDEFDMIWAPDRTIKVGEGFFIRCNSSKSWTRRFSVND